MIWRCSSDCQGCDAWGVLPTALYPVGCLSADVGGSPTVEPSTSYSTYHFTHFGLLNWKKSNYTFRNWVLITVFFNRDVAIGAAVAPPTVPTAGLLSCTARQRWRDVRRITCCQTPNSSGCNFRWAPSSLSIAWHVSICFGRFLLLNCHSKTRLISATAVFVGFCNDRTPTPRNCSVFECEDPSPVTWWPKCPFRWKISPNPRKSSDFPIDHINPPPLAEGCWLLGAKVPAGYAFGINENDPVAVGHGIPRCFTAKPNRLEHIKVPWILAGSPTCWLCPLVFHNHSGRLMGD